MPATSLAVLPSLVAAILVPPIAIATLYIERGSRRGLGMAGFLFLFAAAEGTAVLMHATPPDAAPPLLAGRLSYLLGAAAYLPMIEFLADLAERSGLHRPLGVPLRAGKWAMRAIGVVAVAGAFTDLFVVSVVHHPDAGWVRTWGPAWPVVVLFGGLFVAWGVACWDGERRRAEEIGPDLWAWLAALLLLTAVPIVTSTLLPASGLAETNALNGIFTVLGALATVLGLLFSRDIELRRLRKAPAKPDSDTAQDTAPIVLACSGCCAPFRSLPPGGECPLCVKPVEAGPDPIVGMLVNGCYKVLELLGEGGMARVYAAEHHRLGVRVAIKVIWGELITDEENFQRFLREASATVDLQSPHIVRVRDVGELAAGLPYLLMELVDGVPLDELILVRGRLAPKSVALLGAQIARGLAVAHSRSVIHRDLKPKNIMIVRGADGDAVKIVDFGLAKRVGTAAEKGLTKSGMVVGTPYYMSPEQVRGDDAGPGSDLYSLGVLLYEAASGVRPFDGATPRDVVRKHLDHHPDRVPVEGQLGDVIMSLLDKRARWRPRDAGEVAGVLAGLAAGAKRLEGLDALDDQIA